VGRIKLECIVHGDLLHVSFAQESAGKPALPSDIRVCQNGEGYVNEGLSFVTGDGKKNLNSRKKAQKTQKKRRLEIGRFLTHFVFANLEFISAEVHYRPCFFVRNDCVEHEYFR
jgi:hypothetical protein